MVERKRQDSSRDLLEELEDGWGTPPPPKTAAAHQRLSRGMAASGPDLTALDEGWLDELFPEEEAPDDEHDDDVSEPELPDERLDPEAFALAKKARDQRAVAKKDRKKAKLDAKRARQRARAAAMQQKQKGKSKKSRAAPERRARGAPGIDPSSVRKAASDETIAESVDVADEADLDAARRTRPKATAKATTARRVSTIASFKLLAVVLAILLALAAVAAALMK